MGNAQGKEDASGVTVAKNNSGGTEPKASTKVIQVTEATFEKPTTDTTKAEELDKPAQDAAPTKKSTGVLSSIKSKLKNILDPPEPERLPPRRHVPKRMLYGCETADDHYEYIEAVCAKIKTLKGQEGLTVMGFEFRLVHHAPTCTCPGVMHDGDDDLTDSEDDENELNEGYRSDISKDQIGYNSKEEEDEFGQFADPSLQEIDENHSNEPVFVPLGTPLKSFDATTKSRNSSSNNLTMSRNSSAASLFSLATHNTTAGSSYGNASSGRSGKSGGRFPLSSIASQQQNTVMAQDACAFRLHHLPSGGTMITPENHLQFVADGEMYDELARLCMEYAEERMIEEGDLEWMTICKDRKFGVLASKSFLARVNAGIGSNGESTSKRKILVVVTGKGEVTAGVFSRRHLLVTSMEAATALPFIRGAKERDMDIVMLDPNALGYRLGMDVVEASLERLFLNSGGEGGEESKTEQSSVGEDDIYILAHSMAGAQIVRFFMNNPSSYSRPPSPGANNGSGNGKESNIPSVTEIKESQKANLLQRVQAIALTDSNHNINWTKKHPSLTQFLTGRPSLYIKSHKVHEKAKRLGEAHHDCQFWRHRFGNIKTLWAGTHEHALTNYTARKPIWEHFDSFLKPEEAQ